MNAFPESSKSSKVSNIPLPGMFKNFFLFLLTHSTNFCITKYCLLLLSKSIPHNVAISSAERSLRFILTSITLTTFFPFSSTYSALSYSPCTSNTITVPLFFAISSSITDTALDLPPPVIAKTAKCLDTIWLRSTETSTSL